LGRSDYESVLQELVSQDLAFLKKRVGKALSKRGNFLNLPQEEIERVVSSISPIRDEHSRRMLNRWHTFHYPATRDSCPTIVVETGVLKGHSSSAILGGMAENDIGTSFRLTSPRSSSNRLSSENSISKTASPLMASPSEESYLCSFGLDGPLFSETLCRYFLEF